MMLKTLVFLFCFSVVAAADGINCKGSSGCRSKEVLSKFNTIIAKLGYDDYFTNGQRIACIKSGTGFLGWLNPNDGYCLFLQGVDGKVDGYRIKQLLLALMSYGCEGCGSVPLYYPSSNDPVFGILTSNYVANRDVACDGLCK